MIDHTKITENPGVYKLINTINGHSYIGKSVCIRKRIAVHKVGNNQVVCRAIRKHGWDSFAVEILHEYDNPIENIELLALETAFIENENTIVPNGYNVCLYSNDRTGATNSKKSKIKLSKTRIRLGLAKGANNPMYGKHHSVETKNKIKLKAIGRRHTLKCRRKMSEQRSGSKNAMARKIIQLDKKTDTLIRSWDSIIEAANSFGVSYSSGIRKCLSGHNKSAYGFMWKYC